MIKYVSIWRIEKKIVHIYFEQQTRPQPHQFRQTIVFDIVKCLNCCVGINEKCRNNCSVVGKFMEGFCSVLLAVFAVILAISCLIVPSIVTIVLLAKNIFEKPMILFVSSCIMTGFNCWTYNGKSRKQKRRRLLFELYLV